MNGEPSTSVPWQYPLLILSAMLACGWLVRRNQKSLPLSWREKLAIGLGGFCGAMLGAKLPFVLSDPEGLRSGWAWFSHGKTIMTGLAGGYLGVEMAKWTLAVQVKTGDTFAAPVALAVAIGRVACFEAGCCYGRATSLPWGCRFPLAPDRGDQLRHPTQLYEVAFHLLAFVTLIVLQRRGVARGHLMKLYIMTYCAYRFASEWLRPEPIIWQGLTGYQWAAVILVPIFVALWFIDHRTIEATSREGRSPQSSGS